MKLCSNTERPDKSIAPDLLRAGHIDRGNRKDDRSFLQQPWSGTQTADSPSTCGAAPPFLQSCHDPRIPTILDEWSANLPEPSLLSSRIRLDANAIIDGGSNPLLAAKVAFGRLHR